MSKSDIEFIQQKLGEIEKARANATQGEWKFTHSVDRRRGSVIVESRADIHHYDPQQPDGHHGWKYANALFIAISANEITKLTKALTVAVENLKCNETFHRLGGIDDCEPCKAISQIREILK